MSNQKLVQLGAQWCITSDATIYSGDASLEKPLLFDAVRKTTDPDNFYYVHTTVHLNPNREMGKDNKKQMAFQGEDVLDLKALAKYLPIRSSSVSPCVFRGLK